MKNKTYLNVVYGLILALLGLMVYMVFYSQPSVPTERQQQIAERNRMVSEKFETINEGDALVAKGVRNGQKRGLFFIVSSKSSARQLFGYQPFYGDTSNKLLIGDVISVLGDDNEYSQINIIAKENVWTAFDVMLNKAGGYHK